MKLPQIQSQFVVINGSMDLTTPPISKAHGEAINVSNTGFNSYASSHPGTTYYIAIGR